MRFRGLGWGLVAVLIAGVALAAKPAASKKPTDEKRGEELYERHCVQCHGPQAAGDGPLAAQLKSPVPNLRGKLPEKDFERIAKVVASGKGMMPGFSASFDDADAKRALKHMAKKGKEKQKSAPKPKEPAPDAP